MRTLIIGGGVAGMAAAIAAARAGQAVTVLERGRRPLKKLGVTATDGATCSTPEHRTIPAGRVLPRRCWPPCPMTGWRRFGRTGVPLRLEEEGAGLSRLAPGLRGCGRAAAGRAQASVEIIVNARVAVLDRLPGGGFEAQGTVCRYLPTYPKRAAKPRPVRWQEGDPRSWVGRPCHRGGGRGSGPRRTARTAALTASSPPSAMS